MDVRNELVGGRFRLEASIDSSERYAVWRAIDEATEGRVALKRLQGRAATDSVMQGRFTDEARFTRMMGCPHVVRWVADGVDAQGPWLATEWVEGVSALQLLQRRNRALSLSAVLSVGAALLGALAAAHGPGVEVIHRGVVPSHVLLGADGVTKLTGLGLAKHASHARLAARGDLPSDRAVYSPPESLRGEVHGVRGDLYAVGAVLWELFSGRRLESYLPSRAALESPRPALRRVHSDVPAPLAEVIDQALSLDPLSRPPSATVMAFALRRAGLRCGVEASRDELGVCVWGANRLSAEGEERLGRAKLVRRRYINPVVVAPAAKRAVA
ncbi:MAG: serine/threonine-protein kinase [Polyangiales bacterium]